MSNSKQQTIVALVKHTDLFLTFTEHQDPFICCGPSPLFISWPNLAKNQYTLDLRVSILSDLFCLLFAVLLMVTLFVCYRI